jgi:Na+/melibiose symporter-like transporter
MKFKSRKDILFITIILGLCVLLLVITLIAFTNDETKGGKYFSLILMLSVIALLLWLFFGTNYELNQQNQLVYKSGPLRGKIDVDRITEIVKGQTLWVGLKPATARNGLIVKYDKYNEIYISPKTNESFIKKILELNDKIKITE